MANAKTSPLKSSNAITDWITIAIGIVLGVLGFFYVLPDLQAASDLGKDVTDLIVNVKLGAWGTVLTVAIKIWNTVSHLIKKD